MPTLHLLWVSRSPHHEPPAIEEAQCGSGAVPRNALLLRLQGFHLRCAEQGVCTNQPQAGGQGFAEEHWLAAVDSDGQGDQSDVGQREEAIGEAQPNHRT